MSPDKARHDEVTFQVPTRLPPQEEPLGQLLVLVAPPLPPLAGEPPLPVLPPLPVVPPEPPPLPIVPPEPELELEPVQPLAAMIQTRAVTLASPSNPFRMRPHEACRRRFCCCGSSEHGAAHDLEQWQPPGVSIRPLRPSPLGAASRPAAA